MDGLIRASLKNPIAVTVMVLVTRRPGGAGGLFDPRSTSCRSSRARRCRRWFFTAGCRRPASRRTSPRVSSEAWARRRADGGLSRGRSSGISIVRDYFRSNVDRSGAMTEVNSLAGWEYPTMPPGTLPPVVLPYDPTSATPVCLVALDSATQNEATLFDVGRYEVRPQIMSQPGAIAPLVYGGKVRAVMMYLDRVKLQARQLSPMDVMNAVDEYNVFLPTGSAKFGTTDYAIDSNSMFDVGRSDGARFRCATSTATPRSCATWRLPRTPTSSRPTSCASMASARFMCRFFASSARARSTWSRTSRGRSIRFRRV